MKKLAIVYGQNVGDMQRLAVKQLTEILLDHTMEYPVCVEYGSGMDVSDFLCMYVGTRESHPYIREHGGRQPVHPEGYAITVKNGDWMAKNRIERKHKIWKYIQACWLAYADNAQEMVRLMQQEKQGDLCVTALVEDGMFEKQIMYPAALYAEMLWDAEADIKETLSMVALREYVTFV